MELEEKETYPISLNAHLFESLLFLKSASPVQSGSFPDFCHYLKIR
jgi:hypothetical protein